MADTTTTGAPAKPPLQAIHGRLHALDQYLLEVTARTQAAGSSSAVLSVASMQQATQVLTQSLMDLEAWLPTT